MFYSDTKGHMEAPLNTEQIIICSVFEYFKLITETFANL